MSGALEKSLAILEHLARHPEGAGLAAIAGELNQLRSGCHRTLHELVRHGYVRQLPPRGDYALTTKLASIGLGFLSRSRVVDVAQPILDTLARAAGELVGLAVVDGARLVVVATAQGAHSGLLYDPGLGAVLALSCSAGGHAWLATMSDEQAVAAVTRQGIATAGGGPHAPTTIKALLKALHEHRRRGHVALRDVQSAGLSELAAPLLPSGGSEGRADRTARGAVLVAGPSARLTDARMRALAGPLLAAAEELACAGEASPLLRAAQAA